MVGYLGSHFDKEIFGTLGRLYIPPEWTGGVPWVPGTLTFAPIFFWTLVVLTFALSVATISAQSAAVSEKLFTMPMRGFLDVYARSAQVNSRLVIDMPGGLPVKQIHEAIRAQLEGICNVVKTYDNDRVKYVYGCNIMLYHPANSPGFVSRLSKLNAAIKCIEAAVSLSNLGGVLELQRALSVTSENGRARDRRLRPLALPLPRSAGPVDELDYIPGAPLAFACRSPRVYRNQTDLVKVVDQNRRFSSKVLQELIDTLGGQQETVQGMICIPLFAYYSTLPIAIGVLNIHKDKADEHIEEKFSYLAPLLAPMVQNVERLLAELP
jgi:hypothetical protein